MQVTILLNHSLTVIVTCKSSRMEPVVHSNYNLESYGKQAFSVAAPRLWNSLPMELKTSTLIDIFKKKLKTYLFKHSYF